MIHAMPYLRHEEGRTNDLWTVSAPRPRACAIEISGTYLSLLSLLEDDFL